MAYVLHVCGARSDCPIQGEYSTLDWKIYSTTVRAYLLKETQVKLLNGFVTKVRAL